MKLIYQRDYKSITKFEAIELEPFSILTGKNGAGKSHLLEAIENGSITIDGIQPNQPHQSNESKQIRRFSWGEIYPQGAGTFTPSQVAEEQSRYWRSLCETRSNLLKTLAQRLSQLNIPYLRFKDGGLLPKLKKQDLISAGLSEEAINCVLSDIQTLEKTLRLNFLPSEANRDRFLERLDKNSEQTPLLVMNRDDFDNNFPLSWHPTDLFQQSFARLFTAYNRTLMLNKLKRVAKDEGIMVNPLSDEDFFQKFGQPPWDIVNEIFAVAALDFRMRPPYFYEDGPYEAAIFDTKRQAKIQFHDLSSGERILMSFALFLYHVQDEYTCAQFPKVLLFDEIDAPVHPSMTKSLLNAIQQVLVEKYNIKVILTTHSPSTVALTPEPNIFVMEKYSNPRISNTTKDKALGILTAGVPTLSVNYQNRRQVFVESSKDVQLYDILYKYAKNKLNPEISLAFISSGIHVDGDCSKVKSIVSTLSCNGTTTVRGIVDWDKINKSTDSLFVLGEDERYSIENFVFDPVLLGFFLLREKFCEPSKFGLDSDFSYLSIDTLTQHSIQKIADKVIISISSKLTPHPENDNDQNSTVCFEYENGFSIKVPAYFSQIQGHKLEEAIKQIFPQLNKYHQEPKLKVDILEKVISDSPGFIPKTIINLFSKLQD